MAKYFYKLKYAGISLVTMFSIYFFGSTFGINEDSIFGNFLILLIFLAFMHLIIFFHVFIIYLIMQAIRKSESKEEK